ncbi:MAG: FUSC family protein [Actinomycetota bacterium]|nr:FUSC family protein [Actinomycetota bacterium]
MSVRARLSPRWAVRRLRPAIVPIVQTMAAATIAYYIAQLLPLDDQRPVFASIAAVISLGATYANRGRRAVELIGGVVLGLSIADVIILAIGTGPLQIGLMILLAMGVATILGGGELFVNEAAISALLLASLERTSTSYSPDRFIEALVGGTVALVVGSVFLPPDPQLLVGRAAQRVFADLGYSLEELAAALADGDAGRAEGALRAARGTDGPMDALEEALKTARETARMAPMRRTARMQVQRYSQTLPQIDLMVRDQRDLARLGLRYCRSRLPAPELLSGAASELSTAVWALAAAFDEPDRGQQVRDRAVAAAAQARAAFEAEPDLVLTEIVGGVRTLAADVIRAAELATGSTHPTDERPTEELLATDT